MTLAEIVASKKGTIVDVRSPEEFASGSVASAVNIPLQEIGNQIEKLNALPAPLILCCASGGRSGMAQSMLSQAGIACYNGGSWLEVNGMYAQ